MITASAPRLSALGIVNVRSLTKRYPSRKSVTLRKSRRRHVGEQSKQRRFLPRQRHKGSREMKLTLLGIAIIAAVVAAGFIRVSDAEWRHYRLLFPTLAGLGLAAGFGLIVLSFMQNFLK